MPKLQSVGGTHDASTKSVLFKSTAAARGRRNGGDVGRSKRDSWKEMSLGHNWRHALRRRHVMPGKGHLQGDCSLWVTHTGAAENKIQGVVDEDK